MKRKIIKKVRIYPFTAEGKFDFRQEDQILICETKPKGVTIQISTLIIVGNFLWLNFAIFKGRYFSTLSFHSHWVT